MPIFGTIAVWTALGALLASIAAYLAACARRGAADGGAKWARLGRAAFVLAAASVLAASATLGTLLVTHRFDVQYVYDHSARAMAPLYYFPSFWAGQEGSFLLMGASGSACLRHLSGREVRPRDGAARHAGLRQLCWRVLVLLLVVEELTVSRPMRP